MDTRFNLHNLQLDSIEAFRDLDPQMRMLKQQSLIYREPYLDQFPKTTPGIYTVTGGRQIGKTTLIKQWMLELMNAGIQPQSIFFITGELIDDHHSLVKIITNILANMPTDKLRFLMIDEITYIKNWDKGIKFLADAGQFENAIVILTGSDTLMLEAAVKRFPGRRGKAAKVNFHIYPLSFKKVIALKNNLKLPSIIDVNTIEFSDEELDLLYQEFHEYLVHGGFLTAINDYYSQQSILDATLNTYSEWIRGDILRTGKQERYLHEILEGIIKRYGSQITWHSLAEDLSIDHHQTVAEYIELLSKMDAVFIQRALIEDKLLGAPKKARKIMFCDPFIFHAIQAWVNQTENIYEQQILPNLENPNRTAALVEACVATHIRCMYPTYYIKANAEVDVAYVKNKRFWPVEVKWTNQIRPKDLKQISKYSNGVIYTKLKQRGKVANINTLPLPIALLQFDY